MLGWFLLAASFGLNAWLWGRVSALGRTLDLLTAGHSGPRTHGLFLQSAEPALLLEAAKEEIREQLEARAISAALEGKLGK